MESSYEYVSLFIELINIRMKLIKHLGLGVMVTVGGGSTSGVQGSRENQADAPNSSAQAAARQVITLAPSVFATT